MLVGCDGSLCPLTRDLADNFIGMQLIIANDRLANAEPNKTPLDDNVTQTSSVRLS